MCLELVAGREGRKECCPGGGIAGNLSAEQPDVAFLPKYSNMNGLE